MKITREILSEKLDGLLSGKISRNSIYEWALSVAVSRQFDQLAQEDPLADRLVKDFMDIQRYDTQTPSVRKLFEYYRRCLAGEDQFEPENLNAHLEQLTAPESPLSPSAPRTEAQGPGLLDKLAGVSRLYVIIFALCSLCVQLYSLVNPAFLRVGAEIPSRLDILFRSETPLLLIYALAALVPPRWVARGPLFYLFFPPLTFGMLYYWYISMTIVTKYSLHIMFLLVFLPFGALPATLALILLMLCREDMRQPSGRRA